MMGDISPVGRGGNDQPQADRLRASHEDGDRVIEVLRVAAGDGRLTAEELDERVASAFSARTYGELAALRRAMLAGKVHQPLKRTVEHRRVDDAAGRLRVNAVWPEQVVAVYDRVVPVGQHDTMATARGGGEGRVDLLLPWPGLEGVHEDKLAVRPGLGEELADLGGGDGAVGAEPDHDDGAEQPPRLEVGDDLQSGTELPADHGIDVDPWQRLLQGRRRREHDRVADSGQQLPGDLARVPCGRRKQPPVPRPADGGDVPALGRA